MPGTSWKKIITDGGASGFKEWELFSMLYVLIIFLVSSEFGKFHVKHALEVCLDTSSHATQLQRANFKAKDFGISTDILDHTSDGIFLPKSSAEKLNGLQRHSSMHMVPIQLMIGMISKKNTIQKERLMKPLTKCSKVMKERSITIRSAFSN